MEKEEVKENSYMKSRSPIDNGGLFFSSIIQKREEILKIHFCGDVKRCCFIINQLLSYMV